MLMERADFSLLYVRAFAIVFRATLMTDVRGSFHLKITHIVYTEGERHILLIYKILIYFFFIQFKIFFF